MTRPPAASILVVEDDPLIALDLAQLLREQGHVALGPASSIEQALALLHDQGRPDAAILDEMVRGRSILPVAQWLDDAGCPFLIVSGHAAALTPDPVLVNAPRLAKPVSTDRLATEVRHLLSRKGRS